MRKTFDKHQNLVGVKLVREKQNPYLFLICNKLIYEVL